MSKTRGNSPAFAKSCGGSPAPRSRSRRISACSIRSVKVLSERGGRRTRAGYARSQRNARHDSMIRCSRSTIRSSSLRMAIGQISEAGKSCGSCREEAMIETRGIDHVVLHVNDPQRSKKCYTEILGTTVYRDGPNQLVMRAAAQWKAPLKLHGDALSAAGGRDH